jgi:molecular chaperone Hsp33
MTFDHLTPFQLEKTDVIGRIVRLGNDSLDPILSAHNYPAPVARLLAEAVCLCSLLGSLLKYEGIFTLQIKGDGPVTSIVSDMTTAGHLRGFAGYSKDLTNELPEDADLNALLGDGRLAFTVDQGADSDLYQGIVELTGNDLSDAVRHYFKQSQQVNTGLKITVDESQDGAWQAGGIMVQSAPPKEARNDNFDPDAWRRAMVLMTSVTPGELLDPDLTTDTLLYRLFHEDGVRRFDDRKLSAECRCSVKRAEHIIRSMNPNSLDEYIEDDELYFDCEFCGERYTFNQEEIDALTGVKSR